MLIRMKDLKICHSKIFSTEFYMLRQELMCLKNSDGTETAATGLKSLTVNIIFM